LDLAVFVAGSQIGFLATVLIAVNNLRDMHQDRLVGKRTMAVRLGEANTRRYIVALILLPFLLNLYWLAVGESVAALASTLLALPLAWILIQGVERTPVSSAMNGLLAQSAALHCVFGFALSFALWWF
jgi:1,4-dihydroxy-2-naphthoate polyprenyltransferase